MKNNSVISNYFFVGSSQSYGEPKGFLGDGISSDCFKKRNSKTESRSLQNGIAHSSFVCHERSTVTASVNVCCCSNLIDRNVRKRGRNDKETFTFALSRNRLAKGGDGPRV